MKRPIISFALSIAAAAMVCGSAFAYTGENFAPETKVTMEQAIATAQRARPGKITDKELEREGGGSGLRYSFDVLAKGHTYEVGVDAVTGKVLENDLESKSPD